MGNIDIAQVINRYVALTKRRNAIEAELTEIKTQLRDFVKLEGNYADGKHSVSLVVKHPAPNFDSSYVESLYNAWLVSEEFRACAVMLEQGRSFTKGAEYVLVK